jgi:hypothetical protein
VSRYIGASQEPSFAVVLSVVDVVLVMLVMFVVSTPVKLIALTLTLIVSVLILVIGAAVQQLYWEKANCVHSHPPSAQVLVVLQRVASQPHVLVTFSSTYVALGFS